MKPHLNAWRFGAIVCLALGVLVILALSSIPTTAQSGFVITPCASPSANHSGQPTFQPPTNTSAAKTDATLTPTRTPTPCVSPRLSPSQIVRPLAGTPGTAGVQYSSSVLYPDFSYGTGTPGALAGQSGTAVGLIDGLGLNGFASRWLDPTDNTRTLHLTWSNLGTQSASGWYATQLDVADGFQTTFRFRITNGGADGMAFLIQNSAAGINALGGTGGGVGYGGISNSVAVEFDTYQNGDLGDPNDNHIGIQLNGDPNHNHPGANLGGPVSVAPINMKDGQVHTVRIEYGSGTMRIFIDNIQTPILNRPVDLAAKISLTNGKYAWVGFTASTASGVENHDILSWEFTPNTVSNLDARTIIPTLPVVTAEFHSSPTYDPTVINLPNPLKDGQLEVENWINVWRPQDLSKGPFPIIIILHGNHSTCGYIDTDGRLIADNSGSEKWHFLRIPYVFDGYTFFGECTPKASDNTGDLVNFIPIRSDQGYDYLARSLAQAGYFVVSINANLGITDSSASVAAIPSDGYLILPRAALVLRTLELLYTWNTLGNAPPSIIPDPNALIGKLDFKNVGLIGHSRGGEGVRTAYNLYKDSTNTFWSSRIPGMKIKAIFEIAPTDTLVDAPTPNPQNANGVAWNVLLPMCDGDVANLQGIGPFDRMMMNPTERPAVPKSSYTVWGANHNFYNTQWQESDASDCLGLQYGNVRLFFPNVTGAPTGSLDQQQTALVSVLALMRANVGDSSYRQNQIVQYNLHFNPLTTPAIVVPTGTPTTVVTPIRVDRGYIVSSNNYPTAPYDGGLITVFNDFDFHSPPVNSYVFNNVTWPIAGDYVPPDQGTLPYTSLSWPQGIGSLPYWETQVINSVSVIAYNTVDFRIARVPGSSLNSSQTTDFFISLTDASGNSSYGVELANYTNLTGPVGGPGGLHPILQTVRIPLCDFLRPSSPNFQPTQVLGVRFTFFSNHQIASSGAIYLANVQLSRLAGAAPTTSCVSGSPNVRRLDQNFINRSSISSKVSELDAIASFTPTITPPRPDHFSVLLPTSTMSTPTSVEITLITPHATLDFGENINILQIGGKQFHHPCRTSYIGDETDSLAKTVCSLTPSEFALVSDGEEVNFQWGQYKAFFGPLNKTKLQMIELLDRKKQLALDDLKNLRAEYPNTQQDTRYDNATQQLIESLKPAYWLNGTHLQPMNGADIFNIDINVVTVFQQIMDNSATIYEQALLKIIVENRILYADSGLAKIAFAEASAAKGTQTELIQADKELMQGGKDEWAGHYVDALTHYRNAWQHAMNAMQSVTPAPTLTPSPTATPTATP